MDDLNASIEWWTAFAHRVHIEQQHFDDYLNDLDSRRSLGRRLDEVADVDIRRELTRQVKIADEEFIRNTDSYPDGIVAWNTPFHPDTDWMFYRIPRNTGRDFPQI